MSETIKKIYEPEDGRRVYAITGTEIRETGKVSWSWMMKDGIPFNEFGAMSGTFGFLELKEKDGNYFDPWRWAEIQNAVREEESQAEKEKLHNTMIVEKPYVGSDGTARWNVNVFGSSGIGFIMGMGVDDDPEGEGVAKLIEETPNCVLLMHRAAFDKFREVAERMGVEVGVHHFDGELSTS